MINCQLELDVFPLISQTIRRLTLCCNCLTSYAGLDRLTALQYLDISDNVIEFRKGNYDSFARLFTNFTQLQVLKVSNNCIKSAVNLLKHLEHYLPLTVDELYVKKQADKNNLMENGELFLRKRVESLKNKLQ